MWPTRLKNSAGMFPATSFTHGMRSLIKPTRGVVQRPLCIATVEQEHAGTWSLRNVKACDGAYKQQYQWYIKHMGNMKKQKTSVSKCCLRVGKGWHSKPPTVGSLAFCSELLEGTKCKRIIAWYSPQWNMGKLCLWKLGVDISFLGSTSVFYFYKISKYIAKISSNVNMTACYYISVNILQHCYIVRKYRLCVEH